MAYDFLGLSLKYVRKQEKPLNGENTSTYHPYPHCPSRLKNDVPEQFIKFELKFQETQFSDLISGLCIR